MEKVSRKSINEALDKEEYLEPETIRALKQPESSFEVQEEMVKKVIKNTDAPFVDFYVFENVVYILNGMEANTEEFEPPTPEMIWKALEEIKKLREDFELEPEVKTYIRAVFKEEGLMFMPPLANMEDPNIEKIKKKAEDGPFPLDPEKVLENQAIHYLRIQEYLNQNNNQ